MKKELWLLAIIITVGVAIRLALLPVSLVLAKPVDIYIVDAQVPRLLLNLQNPYTHTYSVHNYTLSTFAYLPMVPIYYLPFYLLGDIRYGNIFADVLIMLASYWIAKTINRGVALYAPLTFAVLPASIWLTSVTATNIMIGTAFLMLSFAAVLRKNFSVAAVLLGLGIATNQLAIFALPLFGYYFWKQHKLPNLLASLLVFAGLVMPFFLSSPSKFYYDVVAFQFTRSLQPDGIFSLYSIVSRTFGIQLSLALRAFGFFVPFVALTFWPKRHPISPIFSAAIILFLAAFILPVVGLWNYFLPSLAMICALVPAIAERVESKTKEFKGRLTPNIQKA